jgi:hypothetical protein
MNKNTDKRLLASLDYIDDKFTERAASRIKTRPIGVTGGVSKKIMVKYVALLAACMILLGAAIPIATSLINKLPEIIAPSASNEGTTAPETTPDAELPEEYFSDRYYGGVNNVCKYGDEFIYAVRIQNNASYCNLVKFDPESNKVAYLCADRKCKHTPEDCPLASPEGSGWNMNYIEVFGDWLIYDYSYSGADKVLLGMTVSLYNLKTGESKIASEPTLYKHANSYYVMNGKVYLGISERKLEENFYTESKRYILSYDPETGESVYMCDIPDGVSFVGVSNKRFFFAKGMDEIYSCNYTGDNLKKEEFLDFYPVALSGTYAYKFSTKDDDGNPATKSVYDLATNSKFTIDFGGELHSFLLLEDKIIYTVYKSEDRSGGTELWTCDKRGENKKLLLESDEVLPAPDNCIGSYIICSVNNKVNRERCVFNLETGEFMTVPKISNQK